MYAQIAQAAKDYVGPLHQQIGNYAHKIAQLGECYQQKLGSLFS